MLQTASEHLNGHSLLTEKHLDALLKRGLTPSTIQAAGLRSASADEVRALLKFNPSNSAGIAIPFSHPLTAETRVVRVRPDVPPLMGGKPAKYLSPKGAVNRLYFPPNCAAWLRDPSIPIGITEGEIKVLWAYQCDLHYVGLIGVYGFRCKDGPIPDLDLVEWRGRTVWITYDSDTATNEKVRAARTALAQELYRRGAEVIYATHIPDLGDGHTGMDDFLLSEGKDAFLELDVEELPSPYPRIKLWTGVELRNAALERPPAIVPGWGIRRSGKVLLVGLGGRGKSTLLLQVASNLAAGAPLLGHPQLRVTAPQRVAVFMAEDPLSEVKFRWEQQMRALGYGDEVAQRVTFLDTPGKLQLTNEFARTALFEALRQHHTDICLLDPLVALHDADENDNSAMRGVLDLLTPFQEETGCTFILAHHEPKSPENNGAASSGL